MNRRANAFAIAAFALTAACGGGGEEAAHPATPLASASASASASAASGLPSGAPASQPAAGDWEKWTKDQKEAWMKAGVLPKMGGLFAAVDPSKYGNVGCRTCHGLGAVEGTFKMPNPDLPKLDPKPAAFATLAKTNPKMFDFMAKQVEPTMASLLGVPPHDMKTNTGFGCFNCHTKK